MTYPINLNKVNSSVEFINEVAPLTIESKHYLLEHKWCNEIYEGWLFTNIGYALCIFLYRINNTQSHGDNFVWVIVGDFPPMYLDVYNVQSTKEVIENYIWLAEDWVKNAELGTSLKDCFPLDLDISEGSIKLLKTKVEMLKNNIINNIENIKFEAVLK